MASTSGHEYTARFGALVPTTRTDLAALHRPTIHRAPMVNPWRFQQLAASRRRKYARERGVPTGVSAAVVSTSRHPTGDATAWQTLLNHVGYPVTTQSLDAPRE